MPLTMYEVSIPVFIRMLGNLSAILAKAADHAEARKIDPAVFVAARLAPDMLPLARQIHIATDGAKGCAARLAGIEIPVYEDTETTFAQLQERIARTIRFLESVDAAKLEGSETRTVTLKMRGTEVNFDGKSYLLNVVLPNVYFHITTAYAILRHNGVEIGKRDFLGAV